MLRKDNGIGGSKERVLDDLRESGEIAQVADEIVLVHGSGRYDETIPVQRNKVDYSKESTFARRLLRQ